jgi:hypothetical protein
MKTLRTSEVTSDVLGKPLIGYPFVFTSISPRLSRLLVEAQYQRCNLNLVLSKKLVDVPQELRAFSIYSILNELAQSLDNAVCFENITMLMNPAYQLDVIKLFCDLARTNRVAFVWPGTFDGTNLVYANPNEPDYKRYQISNYDIVFIG